MRKDAFEDDLHLDCITQTLDQVPCKVWGIETGGITEVNAIVIRSPGHIGPQTPSVTAIALPRIAAPQPEKRLPICGSRPVNGEYEYRRSCSFRASGEGFGDVPFPRV